MDLIKANFFIVTLLAAIGVALALVFVLRMRDKRQLNKLTKATQLILNSPDFHMFANVHFSTTQGDLHADYLLVGQTGIFVVDACVFNQKVRGDETETRWTNLKTGNTFANPLINVQRCASALKNMFALDDNAVSPALINMGSAKINKKNNSQIIDASNYIQHIFEQKAYLLTPQKVKQIIKVLSICDHRLSKENVKKITESESTHRGIEELCPQCGSQMVVETIEQGPQMGQQFYRCSLYPTCRGGDSLAASNN